MPPQPLPRPHSGGFHEEGGEAHPFMFRVTSADGKDSQTLAAPDQGAWGRGWGGDAIAG